MGKRRKFIDSKRDIVHRYKVVSRSQQDPLIADDKAPKSVLQDIPEKKEVSEKERYGIYFDDDYNYIQHLKGVRETVDWQDVEAGEVYFIRAVDGSKSENSWGLKLPSSVFESFVEEPIGMLNKAAPLTGPQPCLDPDILAQLDDDESLNEEDEQDFDNLLVKLNKNVVDDQARSDDDYVSDNSDCYSLSDVSFDSDGGFNEATTNVSTSGFTEYSLTSANLPRSKEEEFLDQRFEVFYLKHYANDKIGELDEESTQGFMDASVVFSNILEPRKKKTLDDLPEEKEWNKEYILATEIHRMKPQQIEKVKPPRKLKYDVETYHAAVKAARPVFEQHYAEDDHIYRKKKLTKKTLTEHTKAYDQEEDSKCESEESEVFTLKTALSLASIRTKFENPEERRERKTLLKKLRSERRKEKKATKTIYKELKKDQTRKGFTTVRTIALP